MPPFPESNEEAKLFHEGIALFNDGEFFEAHEVWEDAWRDASGPRKLFYQGLIQLAVTLEHVRRGNPRGVVTVFESATQKLRDLPPSYMGVRIHELRDAVGALVAKVRAMPAEYFEPRKGRGLEMPVDLNLAPKILVEGDPFA